MFGKTRRDVAYYACEPDQHHHAQRSAWQPGHPASLWVREDILLGVVHGFLAERIFGSARRELLAAQLASHTPSPEPDRTAERADALRQVISDIERRKHALIAELEAQPAGGDPGGNDPDAARQYRQAIQRRFTELVAEHRAKTGELALVAARQDQPGSPDPGLLAALPQLPLRLAGLPDHLQRSLYDAFQLQVRYHRPRHEVTIRVTIRADSLNHINGTVNAIRPQGEMEKKTETRSHVVSAPSRIRTCAHGSGEHVRTLVLVCCDLRKQLHVRVLVSSSIAALSRHLNHIGDARRFCEVSPLPFRPLRMAVLWILSSWVLRRCSLLARSCADGWSAAPARAGKKLRLWSAVRLEGRGGAVAVHDRHDVWCTESDGVGVLVGLGLL
jgi:hypothetical protein